MDKSPDAFRTISEVADWLNTPAHVLRFWESRFTQVKPVKRAGGRRYYRPSDMILLGGIKKLLHDDGMTIRGVQKLLREHGVRYVASMSPALEGVDPVSPLPESLGAAPAAPMAEDVPTGAFDHENEAMVEKVVPFARPEPQPEPIPAPPMSAPDPAPEVYADPPAQPDMFGFDAPADTNDYPDFTKGYAPHPPQDTIEAPIDEIADVPATSLDDDQAFEAALKNALDPANVSDEQASIKDEDVPPVDELTEIAAPIDETAFDVSVDETFLDDQPVDQVEALDDLVSVAVPTVASEDVSSSDDAILPEAPFDLSSSVVDEIVDVQAPILPDETFAAETLFDEIDIDPTPSFIAPPAFDPASVPEDPDDTAQGLAVNTGVLGRLDPVALAAADNAALQPILRRAQMLYTKLHQAEGQIRF
jgi:DNA-binding transcriptional MerR regulator